MNKKNEKSDKKTQAKEVNKTEIQKSSSIIKKKKVKRKLLWCYQIY